MTIHILKFRPRLWAKRLSLFNIISFAQFPYDAQIQRSIGRPKTRWDDHIQNFCNFMFPNQLGLRWHDTLSDKDLQRLEKDYILFVTNAQE